uniref:TH1 domain-containing protein n=1 Tax=Cyprinodon variegatus TaxID=28743 RepID=A0A3Q2CCB6_CYPVA
MGYLPDEYKMGRTKIFIRHPRTLYATEDAYEKCKHDLGEFELNLKSTKLQIETCWRGAQARKEKEKRAWAVKVIKKFIKAYINRGEAKSTDNSEYLAFVRQSYLNRLKNNLPKTVLDKTTWLTPPSVVAEVASEILRKLHYRLMVRRYVRGITPQRKAQLQLKIVTSSIFKDKKENYPQSVSQPFLDTRISEQEINSRVLSMIRNEHIKYSVPVIKYDRNGFKPRPRQLILTQTAAYVVEEAKVKQRVSYSSLKGISVSNLSDGIIVFHITCENPKQKGDLVIQCDHLYEFLTKLSIIANKQNIIKVVQGSIKIEIQTGKESAVDFSRGQEPQVYKAKNGHLMVVSLDLCSGLNFPCRIQ